MDLPEAPKHPDVEVFRSKPLKRAGAVVGMMLTFALGGLLGFGAGEWAGQAPVLAPTAPSTSPHVAVPVITQAILDQKVGRMAFFTGRGQPEGGGQILKDLIAGTGCEVVEARYGGFPDQQTGEAAARAFSEAQPSGLLVSTAVVKAEDPDAAGARYVGTAVTLNCPAADEGSSG